jgi:hypothetical protein
LNASRSTDENISDKQVFPINVGISEEFEESGEEESHAMIEWLHKNNLYADPFKHYLAENEEALSKYYVPFQGFSLISNEIVSSNRNWLFFGVEGSGKTALKQFIASRCAPVRTSKTLAIPYEMADFLEERTCNDIS